MTDDGVGIEALDRFQERYEVPDDVDILDGGTLGLDLLVYMEGYRHILIADCIKAGHPPGTLLKVEGEDVPVAFAQCLSPHQMGLMDLISILELKGWMPRKLSVLGVEPANVEVGIELSEPVRRTLPRLVEAMAEKLRGWGTEPQRKVA